MRWPASPARSAWRRHSLPALGVLLCVALAGCAGGTRKPEIKASQLATLRGSSVQVVVPEPGIGVENDPAVAAKRSRLMSASMGAIPGVGLLGAIALGGAVGAANHGQEASRQEDIRSRSAYYLAVMNGYELAPQLGTRLEKALRTSPNYGGATYRKPTRNPFRSSPLEADSAQTVVEGWANISDDEDEAVVRASVRISSADKKTLWHEDSYRSTVTLSDLVGPSLKQELRGKDAQSQRNIRRARWLADKGKLLRQGLDQAVTDISMHIAEDLGAPEREDGSD